MKMNITEQSNINSKCTGCFACSNSCPTKAITMQLTRDGFYYPVVDKELCIDCGKCVKVCAVNENFDSHFAPKACYAYSAEDDIRIKSSSGGAFYMLAQYILNRHGVVFGAYFNPETMMVEHGSTDDIPLEQIMRSKYVQSRIGNSYKVVKQELDKDRYVLFCGTPCQIYGLIAYLGRNYSKLFTVDFVCHGVPGTGFFRDMVKSISEKKDLKVTDVTFREKDLGWRKQVMKFYFENGTSQTYVSASYYYYHYFLHNITLRNSCYTCAFPENHCSDITMMDYWQIKSDDNKGVSACTVNSDKGTELFEIVFGPSAENIDFECIRSGFVTHNKIGVYKRYRGLRDKYMRYYANNGFEKAVLKKNKKINTALFAIDSVSKYGGKIKLIIRKFLRR